MAFWQAEMFSVELIFTLPRDQILSPTTHTHSELESQISFGKYGGKRKPGFQLNITAAAADIIEVSFKN